MKSTFFFALFVALSSLCIAQDNVSDLESIAAPLINSWRAVKNEKVSLETDRKYFLPGEAVWFKVYLTDSLTNKIKYDTKTLFADLVDDKDSIISQLLLHGGNASIQGKILLPDSLPGGNYWVRAYTRKTISENNNSIGLQAIFVADKNNNKPLFPAQEKPAVMAGERRFSADILPEGGYLVSGANSVVGLKVHDQYGQPVAAHGLIKDIRDSVELRFVTNTNGTAKIQLTPKFHGRYKVFIEQNGKLDSVGKLPAVNGYAAQLSVVAQSATSVNLRVLLEDSIFKKNYTTYVLAINKDSVCFAAVGKGMYELAIPVADLPGGIVKLLLYNQDKQLVSRRDVFINKKNINLTITPIRQVFSTRENVKVDMHVEDVNAKPMIAAVSVAAIPTNFYSNTNAFSTEPLAALSPAAVDLLMLTEQAANGKTASAEAAATKQMINISDTILELKGKIVNSKDMPVAGEEVLLNSTGAGRFYQTEKTDAAGRFSFSLPAFDNGTAFDIQMNGKQAAKDFKVIVDPYPFPVYATPTGLKEAYWKNAVQPGEGLLKTLDSLSKMSASENLQGVTVKAEAVKRKTTNSNIITKEMLQTGGMNNLGQAVLKSGKFHLLGSFLISGGSNGFAPAASDEPIIVMDGMQVGVAADGQDASPVLGYLKTISTNEVEYIKLLTGGEGGSYGVRGGHGVIEIHSAIQVSTTSTSTPNNSKRIVPMGFHLPIAFTMPDYNSKEVKKSKIPDTRTTLYWNGELITASNGNAQVNFFTSDVPGSYTINVQGITNTGEQFSGSTTIVVKAY